MHNFIVILMAAGIQSRLQLPIWKVGLINEKCHYTRQITEILLCQGATCMHVPQHNKSTVYNLLVCLILNMWQHQELLCTVNSALLYLTCSPYIWHTVQFAPSLSPLFKQLAGMYIAVTLSYIWQIVCNKMHVYRDSCKHKITGKRVVWLLIYALHRTVLSWKLYLFPISFNIVKQKH